MLTALVDGYGAEIVAGCLQGHFVHFFDVVDDQVGVFVTQQADQQGVALVQPFDGKLAEFIGVGVDAGVGLAHVGTDDGVAEAVFHHAVNVVGLKREYCK